MFCHECGTKVDDGSLFCINCGSRLPDVSEAVKFEPAVMSAASAYAHTTSYTPERKPPKKVAMNPAIAGVKFSVSSIPMFVLASTVTLLAFILTFAGSVFADIVINILYGIESYASVEVTNSIADISFVMFIGFAVVLTQIYIMAIGMWMTIIGGFKTKTDKMSTAGLKMVNIINKITFAEMLVVGIIVSIILISALNKASANSYLRDTSDFLSLVFLAFFVMFVLAIIYFVKLIGTIDNCIETVRNRKTTGDVSTYVSGMSIVFSVVFYLCLLVQRYSLGFVPYMIMFCFTTCVLFTGISFIRHRSVMNDVYDKEMSVSLLSGFINH